jgi:anti-sigma regulatory factor (Ser/Thr protein kinase)
VIEAMPMMSGSPSDIPYGGACLWQFPSDAGCARRARFALADLLEQLGFAVDVIDNGVLAVSELATNSHQHAGRLAVSASAAVVEMWAWARTYPRRELVVSVFDGCRDAAPRPASGGVLDEHGRGLGIVEALAPAWGWHHSRSRLAPSSVPGKSTWFVLPLPEAWPLPHRVIAPSVAAQRLHVLLNSRGSVGKRRSDAAGISVITVRGLDVWVMPGWFTWKDGDGYARHPLLDLQEAAERVVERIETDRRVDVIP